MPHPTRDIVGGDRFVIWNGFGILTGSVVGSRKPVSRGVFFNRMESQFPGFGEFNQCVIEPVKIPMGSSDGEMGLPTRRARRLLLYDLTHLLDVFRGAIGLALQRKIAGPPAMIRCVQLRYGSH